MPIEELRKKLDEFLNTDKSAVGLELGSDFRTALSKFFADEVYAEVKRQAEFVPMKETLPNADASVITCFDHDIGDVVWYVIYKQVRNQPKTSLRVRFGWQFDVLTGKVEEIQIRSDHGVLYKVNGDYILCDHVFSSATVAADLCNHLNEGTDAFIVEAK